MSQAQLLEKFNMLPPDKQGAVLDFIEFLASRSPKLSDRQVENDDWTDDDFSQMSMSQAMRGMEDEPLIYTFDDLKERWH